MTEWLTYLKVLLYHHVSTFISPHFLEIISVCGAMETDGAHYTTSQGSISQRVYKLIINILEKKLCCFYMENNGQIRPQFCTCHDSSAVMACAKLWSDWIIHIKCRAKRIFTRFQSWAHEEFVKWSKDRWGRHMNGTQQQLDTPAKETN